MTSGAPVDQDRDLPDFLTPDREDSPVVAASPTRRRTRGHVPGETGVWIFILGDMTVFGAIMLALMWERHRNPAVVLESAGHLLTGVGFANTLILLLSSYLVACAIHAHRSGRPGAAARLIAGTLLCATAFVVLKVFEYSDEISQGIVPQTNTYFTYYFALTGLHLAHVVVGTALLTWWLRTTRKGRSFNSSQIAVEGVAVYWHMVDLLWIAIFTLVYLVCLR